jgi:hypothetical protein
VRELATETAATSNNPYGLMNDTWCATPTIDSDEVLQNKKKMI